MPLDLQPVLDLEPIEDEPLSSVNPERRAELIAQLKDERVRGRVDDAVTGALDYLSREVVEPLTGPGMQNQPTRIIGRLTSEPIRDPFPIVAPRIEGPEAWKGAVNAGSALLSGFASDAPTLLAPAGGPAGRLLFASTMAPHLPEQIERAGTVLGGAGTPSEKVEAALEPVGTGTMLGLLSHTPRARASGVTPTEIVPEGTPGSPITPEATAFERQATQEASRLGLSKSVAAKEAVKAGQVEKSAATIPPSKTTTTDISRDATPADITSPSGKSVLSKEVSSAMSAPEALLTKESTIPNENAPSSQSSRPAPDQTRVTPETVAPTGEAVAGEVRTEVAPAAPSRADIESGTRSAVRDKNGRIATGTPDEHHSDIQQRLYESERLAGPISKQQQKDSGWIFGTDKDSFVSIEDVQRHGGDVTAALQERLASKTTPAEAAAPVSIDLPAAEARLAKVVNDATQSPQAVGITPSQRSRPADTIPGVTDLKSVSPVVEERWQAATKAKPSLLDKTKDTAVNAWHSITREYAELPPREFPVEIDILRRRRAMPNVSARQTADVLRGITSNLGPKQYGVFNRIVALEDLIKDVESGKYNGGKELPFGYAAPEQLVADLTKFRDIAARTPQIQEAITRRTEFMDAMRGTLVERGFLPESVLSDPRYFHHQVLAYMAANKSPGTGKSFRDWFSGWQRERVGSAKDYNRQYVEAESEVIADAFNKIKNQDLMAEMKSTADLTPELKARFGEEWQQHIPPSHTAWQPKKGNVFYPVKTIAERVMEDYLAGLKDILPEQFRDAVAIGPKKQEWIIPKPLAKVLDTLVTPSDTWINRLAEAGIAGWKKYILLNPQRFAKYELNNASGDVDFVFAAQPKIFKEAKQAAVDAWNFNIKGKPASGDMKTWLDTGVLDSGWRASEVKDIAKSEYFEWITGDKPGVVDRYWKWVTERNDARENVLRLATARYALKEFEAGRKFYGASVPKDVDALPNNTLKAAKVARELLIDYGRETEFGEFMRRKAIPFYRWMHGNFARYIQLVKNIPTQGEGAAGRTAALGGKKLTGLAAKQAARAAFFYMAANLWNHTVFPKEEEEIGNARNQLHIILGRDDEGNIQTLRLQGALSDILGWFGLEDAPQDIKDLMKGEATLGDKSEEAGEAAFSRLVNSARPFEKTAGEALTKRSLFPNALKPTPIRDRGEHIAGLFSLKNVYRWVSGKPTKGLGNEVGRLLTYSTDPGEAAYNATRHMASEWLEERGDERGDFTPNKRANALYYYKQAIRYKDETAAAKFKAEYEKLGGKQEGIRQGISRSHPLASVSAAKRNEFLKTLSPEERAVVQRAEQWFKNVYKP